MQIVIMSCVGVYERCKTRDSDFAVVRRPGDQITLTCEFVYSKMQYMNTLATIIIAFAELLVERARLQ